MATVLRSYDWSQVSRSNKRARSRSYPWDDWFDGRIWQLEPKTDFDGPSVGMERVIRTSANRRGVKVRIRQDGGAVILQVHDGEMDAVTKSPSLKSIKAQREGIPTNGNKAKAPVKTVKRPTAKKATPTPAKKSRKRLVKASA